MKRVRNLGIAAIAALALTVVLGGSASASVFESEIAATTTLGSAGSEGQHTFKTQQFEASCDVPLLEGSFITGSPLVEAGAKESKCTMLAPSLKTNGCKFTYAPGRESSKGVFEGMVGIGGAGCTRMELGTSKSACWVGLLPKTGYQATLENVGAGTGRSVKVTVNTAKLKVSELGGATCKEAGTNEISTWTGSWTIKGSSGGSPVGIWVKSTGAELPTTGLAIAGTPTKLTAGGYALAINGTNTTSHTMQLSAGKLSCSTATSTSSISAATAEFPLTTAYSGCTFAGLSAKVVTNGCSYTLSVLNHSAPFNGNASIACPAGKAIEIVAPTVGAPKCTVTIGAQSADPEGVSYTNEASSKVGVGFNLAGLDYHQQKGTAETGNCTTLDGTTGTYVGSTLLSGAYQ